MFTVKFETDNEAFGHSGKHETARLLGEVAQRIREGEIEGKIRDINGNTVGSYTLDHNN